MGFFVDYFYDSEEQLHLSRFCFSFQDVIILFWHVVMYHQNNLAYDMFQVFQSGNSRADEIVLSNMAVAFDRVLLDIEVI